MAQPEGRNSRILEATVDDLSAESPEPTPAPAKSLGPFCKDVICESTPCINKETMRLMRDRLRIAAMVLAGALGTFFVWRMFYVQWSDGFEAISMALSAVTLATFGLCIHMLCGKCDLPIWKLRFAEICIFGGPAALFLYRQFGSLYVVSDQQHRIFFYELSITAIQNLVCVYAMFVPNAWQRAAKVIGVMLGLPTLFYLAVSVFDPRTVADFPAHYGTTILLRSCICAATGIVGVKVLTCLRIQALAARKLGQYHLKRLIGAGGMGEVHLAEHELLKRPCAIKLIRPGKNIDPTAIARFEREVQATAKLTHWNTIEIFDYGRTPDGTFYYVMEYLPGMNLAEIVERYGPLPPGRVVHLLRQVCRGLQEAHSKGLIHRDIKPANIFAAERGGIYDVAKVLDFGLVKNAGKRTQGGQGLDLTGEHVVAGSPLFSSPDAVAGQHDADIRGDIYSIGATAYALLAGAPPFSGSTPFEVLIAHARDPVVAPSKLNPDIPEDLEAIVLKCLAKKREDRYQSANELDRALADCEAAGTWTDEDARQWWTTHEAAPKTNVPAAA